MKTMKCPRCGTVIDVTGRVPGSNITCACGNVTTVPNSGLSRKALFLILGLGGVAMLCPCLGIISAIAIPNFIKFQSRSKQAECKSNLKAWYTAERAYHAEKDAYSASIQEVGFSPERGNRYAYFAGPGPLEDRHAAQAASSEGVQGVGVDTAREVSRKPITFEQLPASLRRTVGVRGQCPECEITLMCAGQIDNDETLDVWSISSEARSLQDGTPIPAGVPFNHVNDITY